MPLKDYASEVGSIHFGRVSLSWGWYGGNGLSDNYFWQRRVEAGDPYDKLEIKMDEGQPEAPRARCPAP